MTQRKNSKDAAAGRPVKMKLGKKTLKDLTPEDQGPKGGIRAGTKSITCLPPPPPTLLRPH